MALALCGVRTNDAGMELDQHGTGLFPIACYHENLSREPVPWHWHFDWELGVILQGRAWVTAGGQRHIIQPGEGFFLRSGVLHSLEGEEDCLLRSAVFHPRLVGGSTDSIFWLRCVQPLLEEDARPFFHLDRTQPWHGEVLDCLRAAWGACAGEEPGFELQVRDALSRAALLLARQGSAPAAPASGKRQRDEERVKEMLCFVQRHVAEKLSVADIAASAAVSERECLRCFRNTIGASPIQYLKQFRVQRAAQLLADSTASVAETGAACGFQDPSYFCKLFRERMGCSPAEYRRRRQGSG